MMNNGDDKNIDDSLMALAARLPTEVTPERDLWPGIEQAIARPAKPAGGVWNTVWAQAAAVVLLVAGSSGITYFAVKDDGVYRGPQIVSADNIFESVSGDFGRQFTLGNDYLEARNELEGGLEEKLESLSPDAREDVIKNLNTIRVAINEINESLAREPGNPLLQELLLSTYHEEMSLMIKVDGIANTAMRREDI